LGRGGKGQSEYSSGRSIVEFQVGFEVSCSPIITSCFKGECNTGFDVRNLV
jgi:hypothetical protein